MQIPSSLRALLTLPQNTAIFSHRNPDGDAIGSTLALRHFLEQFGHSVHVFYPSEYPENLTFLAGVHDSLIWDVDPEECQRVLEHKNMFFFLDFNDYGRIDKMGDYVKTLTATRVMIDHHLYPDNISDYMFSEPEASSTCEMVFRFIEALGEKQKINPKVGDCIYTGIITDTGSFRHATNASVFRIVAELIERGVNDTALQDLIHNNLKERHLRLLGHCLYNRMEYIAEYHTAIIWLSKKDYETFDISRGDTEGIVNYMLSIRDVKMAAFIHNQPTVVKISLRSKGDLDVQEICKKHFSGGGHKNAAGAHTFESLRNTVQKFKDLLPLYKLELS